MLLKFLSDHIVRSQDCQVRVRWTEDTVIVFDVSRWLTRSYLEQTDHYDPNIQD